jgi:hypothetical protein
LLRFLNPIFWRGRFPFGNAAGSVLATLLFRAGGDSLIS